MASSVKNAILHCILADLGDKHGRVEVSGLLLSRLGKPRRGVYQSNTRGGPSPTFDVTLKTLSITEDWAGAF